MIPPRATQKLPALVVSPETFPRGLHLDGLSYEAQCLYHMMAAYDVDDDVIKNAIATFGGAGSGRRLDTNRPMILVGHIGDKEALLCYKTNGRGHVGQERRIGPIITPSLRLIKTKFDDISWSHPCLSPEMWLDAAASSQVGLHNEDDALSAWKRWLVRVWAGFFPGENIRTSKGVFIREGSSRGSNKRRSGLQRRHNGGLVINNVGLADEDLEPIVEDSLSDGDMAEDDMAEGSMAEDDMGYDDEDYSGEDDGEDQLSKPTHSIGRRHNDEDPDDEEPEDAKRLNFTRQGIDLDDQPKDQPIIPKREELATMPVPAHIPPGRAFGTKENPTILLDDDDEDEIARPAPPILPRVPRGLKRRHEDEADLDDKCDALDSKQEKGRLKAEHESALMKIKYAQELEGVEISLERRRLDRRRKK